MVARETLVTMVFLHHQQLERWIEIWLEGEHENCGGIDRLLCTVCQDRLQDQPILRRVKKVTVAL